MYSQVVSHFFLLLCKILVYFNRYTIGYGFTLIKTEHYNSIQSTPLLGKLRTIEIKYIYIPYMVYLGISVITVRQSILTPFFFLTSH